jgi:uncharacterized protein
VPSLTFKTIQVYSDGSQVDWIDVPAPGSSVEPEHPAPVLQLAPPGSSSSPMVTASLAAAPAAKSSQTAPLVVAVIALILAAVAAALGGWTYRRSTERS